MTTERPVSIPITKTGAVSGILLNPKGARALFILGHGSGSNMNSEFVSELAKALFAQNVATLRFNYPYSDRTGVELPVDDDHVLIATLQSCISFAGMINPNVSLYVGGHSMSALASILANADGKLNVRAVISLGYPAKGIPERRPAPGPAARPVLFIQGNDDPLGSPKDIRAIASRYGTDTVALIIDGASHSFEVQGQTHKHVLRDVAKNISKFIDENQR